MTSSSAQRIADLYTRSAAEMAAASLNAYAQMTAQALQIWAGAAEAWLAAVPGAAPRRRSPAMMPFAMAAGWPQSGAFGWPGSFSCWTAPTSPYAMWSNMAAATRMFGPFPMAGVMMASGVPSRTAWPAARAGSAAIDAADIATRAVERAFSSYRSDGGHAVAQIVMAPAVATASVAALGVPAAIMALQPWLSAWNAA